MERFYQFPPSAKHYHCFTEAESIKQHPAYRRAKAGDPDAALTLVQDLAWDFLHRLQGQFPDGVQYVAPFAREAAGDNAIPLLLSISCAQLLNGRNETDIVQVQRVFHTGANPMERLLLRPSFEGQVEAGGGYVLVDDVVSMGCTLAELANFIRVGGGRVIGSIILVNAGRVLGFLPPPQHTRLLDERFGNEINEIFGIHAAALTANEASYLVGFRTLDEIRNRCAKAEKETHLRLLSKGIGR